jgi:hypothetical protein
MEVFYESGHIVTNAPLLRLGLAKSPVDDLPREVEGDLREAKEGGMEYFIVAVVDNRDYNVSLRLYNTGSKNMIMHKQAYAGKVSGSAKEEKEEHENIKKTIRAMNAQLR